MKLKSKAKIRRWEGLEKRYRLREGSSTRKKSRTGRGQETKSDCQERRRLWCSQRSLQRRIQAHSHWLCARIHQIDCNLHRTSRPNFSQDGRVLVWFGFGKGNSNWFWVPGQKHQKSYRMVTGKGQFYLARERARIDFTTECLLLRCHNNSL